MLMTFVRDHGVQRVATGSSKGGEQPQSLGQHVTDMGKPDKGKKAAHCIFVYHFFSHMVYPTYQPNIERVKAKEGNEQMLHVLSIT